MLSEVAASVPFKEVEKEAVKNSKNSRKGLKHAGILACTCGVENCLLFSSYDSPLREHCSYLVFFLTHMRKTGKLFLEVFQVYSVANWSAKAAL